MIGMALGSQPGPAKEPAIEAGVTVATANAASRACIVDTRRIA
jgi:hypothetical protein